MINDAIKAKVEKATVVFTKKNGRGVLISNDLIITAAHCIEFTCEGKIVEGALFTEEIMSAQGEYCKVTPVAIEPVNDIAVLGPLIKRSGQKRFAEFCESMEPVVVNQNKLKPSQEFPVHIYSHERTWVSGIAKYMEALHRLWIFADGSIEGGASGGPIINESGELIGIVSTFSVPYTQGKSDGVVMRPHLALPVWVCLEIFGRKFRP
jgi:V8-like Glu-specific endopeptidase